MISCVVDDPELADFHPQAVKLLADALNAYSMFDCTVYPVNDTFSDERQNWMEKLRQAHYILFVPTARYKRCAEQADSAAVCDIQAITERARCDDRSLVCVTVPTIVSPADNIPRGWATDLYEVTGSEQSLQRLVYRLIGVEKGVKELRIPN